MKRFFSAFLIPFLLCTTLVGCSSQQDAGPLRICIDVEFHENNVVPFATVESGAQYLSRLSAERGGPEEVELEIIPGSGTARETALTRIRTEIMSGEGPDVFLCSCMDISLFGSDEDPLFPFPEKAMENGAFLPLDEYIETAQYLEWDKMQPALTEAGKTEKGQMILPISFIMPVTVYEEGEAELPPVSTTLADVVKSGDRVLWSTLEDVYQYDKYFRCTFPYLFGGLADYQKESLTLTEEELYQTVMDVLALKGKTGGTASPHFSEPFTFRTYAVTYLGEDLRQGIYDSTPQVMLPLYNREGGATALIGSFGAVSAGTRQPENAFFVLDLLLSRFMHRDCELYGYLCEKAMPVHVEMGEYDPDRKRESTLPYGINGCDSLDPPAFQAFGKAREQITCVRFSTALDHELTDLMIRCSTATVANDPEAVRKEVADTYTKLQLLLAES